ncbi:ATP-dependent zinc protease [Enterovibrio sp. ZSDZ35]|uniref:ATP-dependent zinc protease n=1 Tax=Enterovibrio qingdaonensis TaxID=2899818 RepID=A0ABT5QNH5_9GAMM|nr:ATP-dependent zinc protease [Enterovibrio sp. ZSDZ35]MDD1782547.1 ATP-dependent zinc protease [Enterovibrio sp. ZSDZ35]
MLTRSGLLILFSAVLSGCSLTSQEQHQQTLDAINNIETNLKTDYVALNDNLSTQQSRIATLEQQVADMSDTLKVVSNTQARQVANEPEPKVVYVDREIPVPQAQNKAILGETEWVWIDAANSNYKARVDTGATTSSLNATDIQEFERDGKTWVSFKLAHTEPNKENNEAALPVATIEAPVRRWVKIRQASAEELERRPVVELRIRLGELHEKTQFTLADRSQMEFPVLLGREFFKDIAVVDVSQSYIHPKFAAEQK